MRNGGWSERNCSHMLEDGFTDWNTPVLVRSQFKLLGSIMVYRLLGVIYPPCPLLILSYSRAVFLISHYDTIPPPRGLGLRPVRQIVLALLSTLATLPGPVCWIIAPLRKAQ